MGKSKGIFPVNAKNFDSLLTFVESGQRMEWFLLFAFTHRDYEQEIERIRLLKNAVFQQDRSDFLRNAIVLGDYVRGYLANDFGVRGVVNAPAVTGTLISSFVEDFNRREGSFRNTEEYLLNYGKRKRFAVDIYDNRDPWIMSVNNFGILFINERTCERINENIGSMKNLTADMILASFDGGGADGLCAQLLKQLGSNSHITFGITGKKSVPWKPGLDALVYSKSPFKEEYMRKFLVETLESRDFDRNFERLREFLGVAPKDFSADLEWDEAEEIAKKPRKYYRLKLLVFDREKLPSIRSGFTEKALTILRRKKGVFRGQNKIEVLTLEALQ
ncbi:MAG: hypothetical protein LBQ96_01050 [Fusobacteriaceae bacterium]|jgi:hypothetical protein|nr:hypothetical protein [Fusobacteriaceae bacterium]